VLQAEGLSGHLSQFWDDIQNSIWIGGKADGDLHERAPYWLNGFVPLAYLLKNANITELDGMAGIYKQTAACAALEKAFPDCKDIPAVRPLDQACLLYRRGWESPPVDKYVSYIMAHQNNETGWLGPDDQPTGGDQYWGPSNVLQSLWQYAEAEPTKTQEVVAVIIKHLLAMKKRMETIKMTSWAAFRWIDLAFTAEWVLANSPQGHEEELKELITMLHDQGDDWDTIFQDPHGEHNVNVAQGLKSAAVEYLASDGTNASAYTALSRQRMAELDAQYGLATGMYVGDELMPDGPLSSPSRGIELCGVVESMYSYNIMLSTHGDPAFGDRVERIAYNALPATWASPRGGDMWAHQYLQAVNEVVAVQSNPHLWTHDNDMSETYGLAPNFGCCTANFNQGWPKLANGLFYTVEREGEEGIAVGVWAPASATTKYGSIEVDTTYPFGDSANVTVRGAEGIKNIFLRIPAWSVGTTVSGAPGTPKNGTFFKIPVTPGVHSFQVQFSAEIRIETDGFLTADSGVQVGVDRANGDLPGQPTPGTTAEACREACQANADCVAWAFDSCANSNPSCWLKGDLVAPATKSCRTSGAVAYDSRSYSVHRGALLYSLPLGLNYTLTHTYYNESKDYEVRPTTAWAFALDADPTNPSAQLSFVSDGGYVPGAAPFNQTGWPNHIEASLLPLDGWTMLYNSAAVPPASPACASGRCGAAQKAALVPHGGTVLRIGDFPLAHWPRESREVVV